MVPVAVVHPHGLVITITGVIKNQTVEKDTITM
jgi:hypothetical protein